jgi:hypothetical protein
MKAAERPERLAAAVKRDVPRQPGVYTWLGEGGEALYVGKSRDLQRRMLSYLSPVRPGVYDRHRLLRFSLRGFAFRLIQGELLALLLEDALIKQLRPRHNERQRDFAGMSYLLVTDEASPRYLVSDDPGDSRGETFGPFKDRYAVGDLVDLFVDARKLAGRGAPGWSIDAAVRAFLQGDGNPLAQYFLAAMERAAEAEDYERAAKARETAAFIARVAGRQRFLARWRGPGLEVSERSSGFLYRFWRGALREVWDAEGRPEAVPGELLEAAPDPRSDAQRALVVYEHCRRGLGVCPEDAPVWPMPGSPGPSPGSVAGRVPPSRKEGGPRDAQGARRPPLWNRHSPPLP